jgi:cell wall-associated NlpC family hydrolase
MIPPQAVSDEARSWVGIPFRHQGRSRSGVDCIGLVIVVAQSLGLVPADFERRDYGRMPNRDELGQKIREHCRPLEVAQPGCMFAMRWNKEAAHVAIYTGETLIHSYERIGRVVEHSFRGRWPRFVDSVWTLPGVSYN